MTNHRILQIESLSSGVDHGGKVPGCRCLELLLSFRSAALGLPSQRQRSPVCRPFLLLVLLLGAVFGLSAAQPPVREPGHWWKGNLHTHSFWSDGDDFPESIADWYKTNGYHFLALSDHNVMQEGERWIIVTNAAREAALDKCRQRFGESWVETREKDGMAQVRLKTLKEIRRLLNERDKFLMIPGEEISAHARLRPIHINATNLRRPLKPHNGSNVTDVIQQNIDAVLKQRRRTGQAMFPHVNHPNFGWAITAEELLPVNGLRFFEVYNGHPAVYNEGDTNHASVERIWDIALAFRLSQLKLGPLFGLAVDDSHNYHKQSRSNSNPGRGWVMVRSPRLSAEAIVAAMEAGDFYASTGVKLKQVRRSDRELAIEIDAEPGVTYTTEFIGTLKGFDPASRPGPRPTNSIFAVTRLYSESIGAVLAVANGPTAAYQADGDELYVRAKITSSKPKANPYAKDEKECAWVQPIVPRRTESN